MRDQGRWAPIEETADARLCKRHALWRRPVELFATMVYQTPRAMKVLVEDEILVWLPKSQCAWDADTETISLPRWIAERKKLIGKLPEDDDPVWGWI